MKVPKQLRVGVPMVGVVLIGYLSLSSVLQGRIQVRDLPSEPPTLLFSPFWWGSSDSLSLSLSLSGSSRREGLRLKDAERHA